MNTQQNTPKTIFLDAAEIADAAERQAFIAAQCGGDEALRAEVEALLRHHQQLGGFLNTGPANHAATAGEKAHERLGIIGPYKLLQQIGEGGMGTVYMAEQTQPVQRKVALKVIKPGMDSRQVIARFEAERQALAVMDHVNIARVLDAGTTESGLPYFVMELVHGVPITKYCDDNHLTPRERLEFFVPVCQAIQHAHQKGIIHRDIKPSNVMVTLYDGKPVPKVIDFGVAKATEQRLTERTLFTQYGTMVGTLEYMSPEQAEMSALGVDTRSDIFSLGVLLYELLTGSTPLTHKRLKEAAYAEVLRIIKEEEAPKPSTRLSESGDALASISAQRQTEPAKLSKLMRGELDWIVMKTLEKDRNRRYETASGFAADVQRYLNDEPVQACPPTVRYRLCKLARRNKRALATAALLLAVVLGGAVTAASQAVRATEAEHQALEQVAATARERDEKEAALRSAKEELAASIAMLDFVENKILAAARPKDQEGGQGYDVKLTDALKAALPFVDKSFANQPLIEARLRITLGSSFLYLGEAKVASEQYQAARAIYTRQRGPDHRDTLASMNNVATSYSALGRYADALKLRDETLSLVKAKLGPDHADTLASMNNLANSYDLIGRFADALKLHKETLALRNRKLGPDHPDTLMSMHSLAGSYYSLGRYAEALKLFEETLALRKAKLGPDHPDTLMSMHSLATGYYSLGRYSEALKLFEATLVLQKAKLGPDHPDTLLSRDGLANIYTHIGRQTDALELGEETLALAKAKLGPDHPATLTSMNNLATSYQALGRHADALKLCEETLALRKVRLGPDHPDTLRSMKNLASSYATVGRRAEALPLFEQTLALQKAKLGPDHPDTLGTMHDLATLSRALGRHVEALKLCEETLALRKAKLGPDHPDTLRSMHSLATSYYALGRHAEAYKLGDESLVSQKATLGPGHPDTLASMNVLAWRLTTCPDAKFRDLKRGVELATKAVELAPNEGDFWNTLGVAHYRAGDWTAAISALEKSAELRKGGDSIDWFPLAMAHWQLDEKDEARKWYDQGVQWMEKNKPEDEELRRFRTEAATLLNVEDQSERVPTSK